VGGLVAARLLSIEAMLRRSQTRRVCRCLR
jgi:hypothetical protein